MNCAFHLNQNTRSYYAEELLTDTQNNHNNFNQKINRIYLTSLKLHYLTCFAGEAILNHFKTEILETEFVKNHDQNEVIRQKLTQKH